MIGPVPSLLADIGVPTIFVTMPMMAVALVPIVAVEACVVRKLTVCEWPSAWKASIVSNLLSTVVGIPVAWFALLAIEFIFAASLPPAIPDRLNRVLAVTVGAPWLGPSGGNSWWMLPTASLFLLIPYFFASCWVERWPAAAILERNDQISRERTYRAVWFANLWSYAGLALFLLCELVYGHFRH